MSATTTVDSIMMGNCQFPKYPKLTPHVLLMSWLTSGVCSVVLPLLVFFISRMVYVNQNGDENENNNGYYSCPWYKFWGCNNNNYNYNNEGENGNNNNNNGYYNQNSCTWYKWWGCNNNYNYNEQQQEEDENSAPWWWVWGNRERRRDDESASPALVFIYIWSLLLFASVFVYGYRSFRFGGDDNLKTVVGALVIFANYSFLSMFFLGGLEGGVQADGPELDENGFYGQFGVLMFMTYFFWFVFSTTFATIFYRRNAKSNVTAIDIEPTDYMTYSESNPEAGEKNSKELVAA